MIRRIVLIAGVVLLLFALILLQGVVVAAPSRAFPSTIPLPNGFQPEGVVTGRGAEMFAGSLAAGAIYRANLRTGQGEILVPLQEGRVAVGLGFDKRSNTVYAAGGPTGAAYLYDGDTGAEVGVFQLTAPGSFVNDVVVTRDTAYFTDSFRPVLYRLPLSPGGRIPGGVVAEEIPLSDDFQFVPGEFNANGIVATPNGNVLVIVNSTLGTLYRVDPHTGQAAPIDLAGDTVESGDGLLLSGLMLYVVQNRLNQIAVIQLQPGLDAGELVQTITHPQFDVPTTLAGFGNSLYAVNARFGTPPTLDTEYEIVRVPRAPVR